ncbi:MAG: peptidoglycan DD-metalloendopeptidase family protein, partial [Longimicrobiales bacterium]
PPVPEDDPRPEFFRPPTPHEAHRLSLGERGLKTTALGSQWLREADRAVEAPLVIRSPYAEVGRFVKAEADALGFRVDVERGQRLEVRFEGPLLDSGRVMMDVFRLGMDPDSVTRAARMRSLPTGVGRVDLEPDEDAEYVVRVQPELFAEGSYRLAVRTVPALRFPVVGRGNGAIWSRFGASRDGGARAHHGIDIFAPRGTPVVAVSDARVRRVRDTPVGGKVVWLRDEERNMSVYYAHLDSQAVEDGQRVLPGDTVGFVGNTGNARTTPPHLHFGLYQRGRGPIDPFPFVRLFDTELPDVRADVGLTGSVARAGIRRVRLRSRPSSYGDVVGQLTDDRPFRVVAATGSWYRIRLPDGSEAFVAETVTEDSGLGRVALVPPPGPGDSTGSDGVGPGGPTASVSTRSSPGDGGSETGSGPASSALR